MTNALRLFVGLELPDAVKDALVDAQTRLQRDNPPVKWVARDAMHLTLQFLGATDPALLPQLGAALRNALAGHAPHELRLGAAGAFPNTRRPTALWSGVTGDVAALERVQEAVVAALEPLGFPREARPFSPHLTIGRVRREARTSELTRLGAALAHLPALPPLIWRVERVVLFESQLRPEGSRYTERDAVALKP